MTTIALVLVLAVLTALAILQILVACGRPYGRFVWGGAHDVLPLRLRLGSAASVLGYAGMAALLLSRAGVFSGGSSTVVVASTWVVFAYFVLGVLVNAISRSPAERWTMTPACALLATATLIIARSG